MFKIYKELSPYILAIVLLIGFLHYVSPGESYNEMSYGVLLRAIDSDMVYSVQGTEESEYLTFILKENNWKEKDDDELQYRIRNSPLRYENVMRKASYYGIEIIEEEPEESDEANAFFICIVIGIIVLIVLTIMLTVLEEQKKKKSLIAVNVVSDGSGNIDEEHYEKVTFADVAGLEEEKEELMDIVDFLKNPDKYIELGVKTPKGVLLAGSPGNGKTLLAKAVAGEAGVAYISMSGSDFTNKYVGVGRDRIKELFEKARESAPCIIFIDEIDAIGAKRTNHDDSASNDRNQTLTQLLTELDGFRSRNDIIILAATNRNEVLDSALMRPGRFNKTIYVGLPDVRAREDILKVHAKDKPLMDDVDLSKIAQTTAGFSGAELENLLNEAGLIAVKNSHQAIFNEDLSEAFKKITVGLKKTSRIMSDKQKKITATHEAGHAIVSIFMPTQAKIKELSIIPHGMSGGYTWYDRTEYNEYTSKNEIVENLAVLMAGRAAEQIVMEDISTEANRDIEVATQIATRMVSVYGMDSKVGPISVKDVEVDGVIILGDKKFDDIGSRIVQIVKDAEESATKIINDHRSLLDKIIQMLLKEETITGDEVQEIYNNYTSKANTR